MRESHNAFPPARPAKITTVSLLLLCGGLVTQSFASAENKADALLAKMTLDEKIGQMTQVDSAALKNKDDVQKYFLGSLLSGGGSDPPHHDNTAAAWADFYDEFQSPALKTRLKIPIIYGIDAVHGHNNVDGAVVFPH